MYKAILSNIVLIYRLMSTVQWKEKCCWWSALQRSLRNKRDCSNILWKSQGEGCAQPGKGRGEEKAIRL